MTETKCVWDYRAVKDEYKGADTEDIKTDLDTKRNNFTVVMSHIEGDFNFGNVVRSANAFGAKEVIYIGGKRGWDRRAAVGAHHYIDLHYLPTWHDFDRLIGASITMAILNKTKEPNLVAIENNIEYNIEDIANHVWEDNTYMIFGEEGHGIPEEGLELVERRRGAFVSIPSVGSIRSMNVASAAAIAMYDFVSKGKN